MLPILRYSAYGAIGLSIYLFFPLPLYAVCCALSGLSVFHANYRQFQLCRKFFWYCFT